MANGHGGARAGAGGPKGRRRKPKPKRNRWQYGIAVDPTREERQALDRYRDRAAPGAPAGPLILGLALAKLAELDAEHELLELSRFWTNPLPTTGDP